MYHDTTELFESEQNILRRSQDAVFWFTKCAEFCQDSWTVSLAEFQLGEMYAKGIGVKKITKLPKNTIAAVRKREIHMQKRSLSQEDMLNNVEGTL